MYNYYSGSSDTYCTYVMSPEVFVIFSSKYENPRGCVNGRIEKMVTREEYK